MENKNKSKYIIICLIVVIVLLVAGGIGYICYEKYQEKVEIQKQEQIEDIQAKYNNFNSQIESLILSEEEQKQINGEMEKIKNGARHLFCFGVSAGRILAPGALTSAGKTIAVSVK